MKVKAPTNEFIMTDENGGGARSNCALGSAATSGENYLFTHVQ
jgi:hypothetical protein